MSNKFKIKNIWTPEISREEYAKTLAEWDNALSSLEDKIQELKSTGLNAPTEWDFISGSNIQINANTVISISNTKLPVPHQLTLNTMYILHIEQANYAYRYGYFEIIIRMNDYSDGICYSFNTQNETFTFSIRRKNSSTIEIMFNKNFYIGRLTLKRLYIK